MFNELIAGKVFYSHLNNDPNIYANANVILDGEYASVPQQVEVIKHYLPCSNVSFLKQIHSNEYIEVDQSTGFIAGTLEADALITSQKGHAICVKTADCVPILLASKDGNNIAIIHAGWRGAFSGIIRRTIKAIRSQNNASEIVAVIGPHIRQKSYEVDQKFYNDFLKNDATNDQYFIPSDKPEHHLFDLTKYVHSQLVQEGILEITDHGINTYTESLYPSYRRSTHQNTKLTNHILSTIMIAK